MRSFVLGDIFTCLDDSRNLLYCYQGNLMRGCIIFRSNKDTLTIIKPNGYMSTYSSEDYENSNFELWALIHEMIEKEDSEVRQEAMNRYFDIYSTLYQKIPQLQQCYFRTE